MPMGGVAMVAVGGAVAPLGWEKLLMEGWEWKVPFGVIFLPF